MSWRVFRAMLGLSAIALAVCSGAVVLWAENADPAAAFVIPSDASGDGTANNGCPEAGLGGSEAGCIRYVVHSSVLPFINDIPGVIHASDQAWKINGLAQQAELWNVPSKAPGTPDYRIVEADAPDDWIAIANLPCHLNGMNCDLGLDFLYSGSQWWTNAGAPPLPDYQNYVDARSVLVHEFGHWFGLDHSTDCPTSDGGPGTNACPNTHSKSPSMTPIVPSGTSHLRTIQADDENGLRVARTTAERNMVANGHTWDQPGHWGGYGNLGWQRANGASTVTRYATGGLGAGGAYINFYGVSNGSFYQDVFHVSGYANGRTITPNLYLRSPTANTTVKVVVWNLNAGVPLYERTCTLPNSWTWQQLYTSGSCTNGPDHDNNGDPRSFRDPVYIGHSVLRYEVYNVSGTNLDIDYARLAF